MNRLYFFIILSCFSTVFYAQETVFPGDANANGIVDQYDLLSIGYTFGEIGPARIQTDDFETQGIPLFWNESFPGGLNYIHADCDGNGEVDYLDFIPFIENFGIALDNVTPLVIEEGVLGIDPGIVWSNGVLEIAINSATAVDIPINLPLNNEQAVNGIAFNLHYSPTYFQDFGYSNENHWLHSDEQAMGFEIDSDEEIGVVKIASTRFGVDPLTGGGNAGVLNIIIIEDLIDYLEAPDDTITTKIYLEDILMVDGNFNPIPVASDTLTLKLYHDITADVEDRGQNELLANVFPNPSSGQFQVSSFHDFNTIDIVDLMGRKTILYNGVSRKRWSSEDLSLSPGLYTLRLSGDEGMSVLKYMLIE